MTLACLLSEDPSQVIYLHPSFYSCGFCRVGSGAYLLESPGAVLARMWVPARAAKRTDAFRLPLRVGPERILLHTVPCEQHHKTRRLSSESGSGRAEMEDGEKGERSGERGKRERG